MAARFDGYHGYKTPEHWNYIRDYGIRRPGGNHGHTDDDWKAFYLAVQPRHASGHAYEPESSAVAGGILRVHVEGEDLTVERIAGHLVDADVGELKARFGVDPNTPLMDGLGRRGIILHVVRPPSDGGADAETDAYVVPWSTAENRNLVTWTRVAEFAANRRGVAAVAAYASTGSAPADRGGVLSWSIARACDRDPAYSHGGF
ncbi:hypothetical protein [Streptomyces sp. L2]|uniref:hypothetical protein n=1 Tax=Streptomyces sp. L2 TaxID=2162665 RepID=UPI0010115660|nr:hypothetical protein [Streptomyces sp. L2]